MQFWRRDRRLEKRLTVSWDAVLKATFVGFEDIMTVTVSNFCLKGVLLYTDNLSVLNQHLMIKRQKPDLRLTIHTPSGEIDSRVEIRWYTWSCEKNLFEVGVNFINLLENNRQIVDHILNGREYEAAIAAY
jgi:hypothetical protein